MKTTTRQMIVTAIQAYNLVTRAAVDLFNANLGRKQVWEKTWAVAKSEMTGREFISAMLAEFDRQPLASVRSDADKEAVKLAHKKQRASLHVQLLRDMPRIDASADWKDAESNKGRKSALAKSGITKNQIEEIRKAIAGTSLKPAQLAAVLKKLGL
jgi:hypothetical protein